MLLRVFLSGVIAIGVLSLLCLPKAYGLENRQNGVSDGYGVQFILDELPENLEEFNVGKDGEAIVKELRRGSSSLKEVALTFDDGPHPLYTAKILAILRYYRVPATFFMVGVQAEKYPQWVQMVFQEGHEIGNHTYDHFRLVNLPYEEQVYQIEEFQRLIHGLTGFYPRFLRPPGGRFNSSTVKLMNKNGLALGLWTINPKDGTGVRGYEMYDQIIREVENGSIILFHDGSSEVVNILPRLIETLRRRGFEFVTMSQMLVHSNRNLVAGSSKTYQNVNEEEKPTSWKVYSY